MCIIIDDKFTGSIELSNYKKSSQKLLKAPEIHEQIKNDLKNIDQFDQFDPLENEQIDLLCKYCQRIFSKNSNLSRHLKTNCKIKKQYDDEKEEIFKKLLFKESMLKEKEQELNKKNEQISKLIFQNDELISKINVLEEKVDKISNTKKICKMVNSNNTTNNINLSNTSNISNTSNTNNGIIVQLVNYGKENLDKIDMKHYLNNIIKNSKASGVKIPEEILKLIYF